jgi:drug/metabolite transporter (DMT)-like permease
MNYLILFTAMLLLTGQTISFKEFNRVYMKNNASFFGFNFIYFSFIALIFLFSGGPLDRFQPLTVLCGMSFGIIFLTMVFYYMKAMETGPLSFTSLFFSMGILGPIVFGVIFWHEKIKVLQFFSLALLFVTFYLCGDSSGGSKKKVHFKWVFYCLLAFFTNGAAMSIMKEHQILMQGLKIREFLIVGFGTASIISMLFFIIFWLKKQPVSHFRNVPFIYVVLGAALTTAFGNKLNLYLNTHIPSIIQFPVTFGGIVILSTLTSRLFYKETLSRKGLIGLGIGLVALILIGIA